MTSLTVKFEGAEVQVTALPLTQELFEPFGDVVSNPRPDVHPGSFQKHSHPESLPSNAVSANQGSAIQYRKVSRIRNVYDQSPSGKGEPAMSVFVCASRQLGAVGSASAGEFTVRVLERHPFTTQTFTPLASSAAAYLVIVAPSLKPGSLDKDLPVPSGSGLPGRGLPDVRALKAFVATKQQAVTYGAGTWHAPMVALGQPGTTLDFVVSQFTSGVPEEDCQLVEFESPSSPDPRITVLVPQKTRLEKL
ncbi:Ureidoglycolate lyase [Paramyrothecium foliicola]|nr:Ureidoglycolate lyase [Paramyrothecium foliicola]